jgi:hypothetical protein
MNKRYLAAVSAGAALVAGVMVAGAPAQAEPQRTTAAVGCYAGSCYGQDPTAMGCGADAVTGVSVWTSTSSLVELRWSNACQAAWARISYASPGDIVEVNGPGDTRQGWRVQAGYTDGWTDMVSDRSYAETATACGWRTVLTIACTDPF